MGGGEWLTDVYAERERLRAATGKSAFDYDATMRRLSHDRWVVHPTLDPKGIRFRESRDSDEHSESVAIAVKLDVTGSMGSVIHTLHGKMPELNGLLVRKDYVKHPQIMFAAVGDATCDRIPLQVGQFESDNRMDENLENLIIEGGGGGQMTESYELGMYFIARHTDIDCWNMRRHKGYLFMIGDEMAYDRVKGREVHQIIGDSLTEDIPTAKIVLEVKKRYEPFYILPTGASHGGDREVLGFWRRLLGQNVLELDDPEAVCETIAWQIGLNEGTTDLDAGEKDLADFGASKGAIAAAKRALITRNKSLVRGTISLPGLRVEDTGEPKTKRL